MSTYASAVASTVYDGGGTGNALQTFTTTALMIAGAHPDVIDIGPYNELDIWLMNSTASQSCTLVVAEFSAATPTAATLTKVTETAVPTTDQAFTSDRAAWGLVTGTEYPAKAPVQVRVTPGRYAVIFCQATNGGTFYARVGLQRVAD
jgi:hypothetical protein